MKVVFDTLAHAQGYLTTAILALCCPATFSAGFTQSQLLDAEFPTALAVADLNGDGKLDFIVGGYSIMVYLGNGDGTFTLKAQYNIEANYVEIGDLNGDGIPDLVTSDAPGVQVFLGNGDGSFRTARSVPFPNFAIANPALGDFNHDGILDIAVASYQTNQVQVFFGNGDATFRSPVTYGTGIQPQYTLAVDLNHDGNLDLVVTSTGDLYTETAGLNILLGNSDGSFQPRSFIKEPGYTLNTPARSDYLTSSDFDGDGNVDLLVQGINASTTFILYGSGAGTFPVTTPVATNAFGNVCVAGDFDGDGKPDIVCAGNGFTIVTNSGNRTFSHNTYFPGGFMWAAAADFNGDGKLDLAVTGGTGFNPSGTLIYLNSRAITEASVSIPQPLRQYGEVSHMSAQVNTNIQGLNTGCFSACPLGSVTWFDGTMALATAALAPGPDHSGVATYDAVFAGGRHSITVSYSGVELPSTSNAVTMQVFPVPALVSISASPPATVYGAGVTITVNATAASDSLALPTGKVTIQDNGAALATIPLNASGQASVASLTLSGGNHTLEAKYSGDANYSSTVATTSLTVQPASVQLKLSCAPNPAASDEALSCVSQVTDPRATGSVAFDDGSNPLGSAAVLAGQAVLKVGPLAPGTHAVQASYSGDSNFTASQSPALTQAVTPAKQVIAIAAADGHPSLAPQAIGTAYGASFATGVSLADPGPLPTMLAGVRMTIIDTTGAQQDAPLFFVSPLQVNFLTPNLASGPARVQVSNAQGALLTGPMTIQAVSPALFSANSDGKGVAAGYVVHVGADGLQSTTFVFACGKAPGSCVPVPVDLGKPSDKNILVLYGSGIRNASKANVLFDAKASGVEFFGPQGQFAGLDQVNVKIPASMAGRGDVDIVLRADAQESNRLIIRIK